MQRVQTPRSLSLDLSLPHPFTREASVKLKRGGAKEEVAGGYLPSYAPHYRRRLVRTEGTNEGGRRERERSVSCNYQLIIYVYAATGARGLLLTPFPGAYIVRTRRRRAGPGACGGARGEPSVLLHILTARGLSARGYIRRQGTVDAAAAAAAPVAWRRRGTRLPRCTSLKPRIHYFRRNLLPFSHVTRS